MIPIKHLNPGKVFAVCLYRDLAYAQLESNLLVQEARDHQRS
jgi:hypothetical protein